MPVISIKPVGEYGLVKDDDGAALPPNAFTNLNNVRTSQGGIETVPSGSIATAALSVAPTFLSQAKLDTLLYGNLTDVYSLVAGTNSLITRISGVYTSDLWSVAPMQDFLCMTNGVEVPQAWAPTTGATKLIDLPNWPVSTTAKLMVAYKNHLIAGGIVKGATSYPTMVKWSHPADPGSSPISWDETDPTKDAGEYPLTDGGGPLTALKTLGDSLIIYKEESAYRVDYIGAPYIFRFTKIHELTGALNANTAVEFKRGLHFVVSLDDIIIHAGASPKSTISGTMRRWIFNQINPNALDRTFTLVNPRLDECWFCYPTGTGVFCTQALIWNYKSNSATIVDLPNVVGGAYTNVTSPTETWATTGTWAADSGAWNSPLPNWIQLASNSGSNIEVRYDSSTLSGVASRKFVERTGWAFSVGRNGLYANFDTVKFVRSVRPRIQGSPGLIFDVYVGAQDTQDGIVRWSGPYPFNPATQDRIDCAVSGRFLAFRFESNGNDSWRFTSYEIDVDDIGKF